MKISKSPIIFFIIIFLVACKSPSEPKLPVPIIFLQIEGVVTDATTNFPIKGASLRLYIGSALNSDLDVGQTLAAALTDQNGYYYMYHHYAGPRDGNVWLSAKYEGYNPEYFNGFRPDGVKPCLIEKLQRIDIKLELY